MEIIKVSNLEFEYAGSNKKVLEDINFSVEAGEFVTLCGASGCGKSTLLRQLKTVLKPAGNRNGNIYFNGELLDNCLEREQAADIGFVSQSQDNQIVTDKVWHEMAFGLESLGYDNEVIRQRVAENAAFFGIENWFYKNVFELSGGQKQILCLASVMTMLPKIIILDEPTSQLDPIAASEFINMLIKINRELGITIIITEHRLEEIIPVSDRVIVMDNGKISVNDTPESVCRTLRKLNHGMILSLPVPMRVWSSTDYMNENYADRKRENGYKLYYDATKCPLTVNQGRKWLEYRKNNQGLKKVENRQKIEFNEKVIEIKGISFKYEKNGRDILKDVKFTAYKGQIYGILGGNGTGKSTLLSVMSGIRKAYRGRINVMGRKVGMLPQNPQTLFVRKTVLENLRENYDKNSEDVTLDEAISICKLEELLNRHPYDLSGGEQQRAALAIVLLTNPDILLLDEPTKGLDNEYKSIFGSLLKQLSLSGKTIIMVSHDVEFCAEYTHKCALFFDGNIVSENEPHKFFSGNSFYTTAGNRMSRGILENAITAEDIIKACKCNEDYPDNNKSDSEGVNNKHSKSDSESVNNKHSKSDSESNKYKEDSSVEVSKRKIRMRNIFMSSMFLLAIPFTIFAGVYYLDDRKYLFIALVVLLECMAPFFLIFEGRNPMAREIVLVAMLCAICVAGRCAFYMLPEFKPLVAIVTITGVCLGAETGFLIGAVTMLVSNIMFGQGPWTPWQMFALGMIGFFAGILFKGRRIGNNVFVLSIYGFFAAVVIYGGIMNPAAAIMAHARLNKATLLSYYATGLPIDLVNGIATVIFIILLAKPMTEKIRRVQRKYNLMEK